MAPVCARGRDRRRHGLAARTGGGLAALWTRLLVLGRLPSGDEQRVLYRILDRSHVRPARARARLPTARALRKAGVSRWETKTLVERTIGAGALVVVAFGPLIF